MEELGQNWLIGQSALNIALGIAIWWLSRRLDSKEELVKVKDGQLLDLSKDVIKVATLWEENKKDTTNKEFQNKVIELLEEVKDIVNTHNQKTNHK